MEQKKQRQSGIELLKIAAMILIVISHVTQTLGTANEYYVQEYIFHYNQATTDFQSLFLAWMGSSGAQGNLIFFTCSAWFLLDSKRTDCKKMAYMIADVWIINIVILAVLEIGSWYSISIKDVIKSVFPTTFALNWYITCYILFYIIHDKLNVIIRNCTQKELLSLNIVVLVLYYGMGYIKGDLFFASKLIVFVVIYFAMAYIKLYLPEFCANKKANLILLAVGIAGTPVMILLTNVLGLHIAFLSDKLTYWNSNQSLFLLLTAIALLNLAQGKKFINPVINKISSLSLLVYIIHENYLLRTYVRPQLWVWVHDNFGYTYVVLWALLMAAAIFVWALVTSWLYQATLQKLVHKVSERLYDCVVREYEKIACVLLKIK